MKKPSLLNDYLQRYAAPLLWKIYPDGPADVRQVVVIPAYAEKHTLFATLASLARNPEALLRETLILCVINNKADAPDTDRENNQQTLALIHRLIHRRPMQMSLLDEKTQASLTIIFESPIRLACIDASSPGQEIPAHEGGVGMARKIGMDMALRILQGCNEPLGLIFSLDADTLVRDDYLPVVRRVFSTVKFQTAILAYEHQRPSDPALWDAISSYEIFLRYVVLGLRYAGSPYAFHSIGSTIVTTAEAYLAVRGMNRREAGEDFYFLNKLAKINPIYNISETKVYPSARISSRVPFGTGAAVQKMIGARDETRRFYDPRIFHIIREWILLMEASFSRSEAQIMEGARRIHPGLADFLIDRKFLSLWPKVRGNLKHDRTHKRQFHNWFDGFETLKLINYFTNAYYPKIAMFPALENILDRLGIKGLQEMDTAGAPPMDAKMMILKDLRTRS